MLWLDSTYPTDSTKSSDKRGTCDTDSGDPDTVEKESPDSSVTFANIKFGAIDSTYDASGSDDTSGSDDGSSGNTCDADATKCNTCDACCKSYLNSQSDCDDCVTSEC